MHPSSGQRKDLRFIRPNRNSFFSAKEEKNDKSGNIRTSIEALTLTQSQRVRTTPLRKGMDSVFYSHNVSFSSTHQECYRVAYLSLLFWNQRYPHMANRIQWIRHIGRFYAGSPCCLSHPILYRSTGLYAYQGSTHPGI